MQNAKLFERDGELHINDGGFWWKNICLSGKVESDEHPFIQMQ
jgi:hypothetical protein